METAYIGKFADGDRRFWLPMSRLIAAEREMGCSIFELFHHISQSVGTIGDQPALLGPSPSRAKQCHALIANALIGGGTEETEARELVDTYCYPARGAVHDLALTWYILSAAIYGVDIGSKKKAPAQRSRRRSTKGASSQTAEA